MKEDREEFYDIYSVEDAIDFCLYKIKEIQKEAEDFHNVTGVQLGECQRPNYSNDFRCYMKLVEILKSCKEFHDAINETFRVR